MLAESVWWTSNNLLAVTFLLLALLIAAAVWIALLNSRLRKNTEAQHKQTERDVAAERRQQQLQRMEAIGKLASGVAHSFNNYLTSILGFSELLLEMVPPNDASRDGIQAIHKSATRGTEFTRQLFALNRKQSLQMELLNLNELLGNMDKSLHNLLGGKIELRVVLDSQLGPAMIDRSQTELVIANLVQSARDSLPSGGQITIETRNVDFAEPFISGICELKAGPYVQLVIRDNSAGMDEQTRAHIFEPFFLPKQKSKGGGLVIGLAYSIVKQSGGDIAVASEAGKGTAFSIYLPRTQ